MREKEGETVTTTKSRDEIRAEISQIDGQLIDTIARRQELVDEIQAAKAASTYTDGNENSRCPWPAAFEFA